MRAAKIFRILAFFAVFLAAGPASAWIETQVRGHSARVEVASDGSAMIRHELQIKIRGGPMKTLEMSGIGTDIEPLPDAFVRSASEGSAGRWPLHPSSMEDGALRLGIAADRGLRGGNYIFSFAYRAELHEKGLEVDGDRRILSWIGPRLSTGVDSAKVTFVVPHGSLPPELAPSPEGPSANVLLGEVRRGAQTDEVDLVRAHLASGEPAVWRISVSSDSLSELATIQAGASRDELRSAESGRSLPASDWNLPTQKWLLVLVLAAGYAVLLFAKSVSVTRLGRVCDAKVLPLVPLPTPLRALIGGALVSAMVWAIFLQRLVWAVVFLGAALLVSTFLLPVRRARARGPGNWLAVTPAQRQVRRVLPGAWFDARSWVGCLFLLSLLFGLLFISYRVLPRSNYLALMTLTGVPLLLPLFWSGNRRDFPLTPLEQALPWFRYLARAIDPAQATTELWGRAPCQLDRTPEPVSSFEPSWDEVRVRLLLVNAPSGLRGVELVLDEKAGAHVSPCVLVRALEDSLAIRRLPADVQWRRGRTPEERVALLRPTAPTRVQTTRLMKLVLKALQHAQESGSSSDRISSGKGQLTAGRPAASMAT